MAEDRERTLNRLNPVEVVRCVALAGVSVPTNVCNGCGTLLRCPHSGGKDEDGRQLCSYPKRYQSRDLPEARPAAYIGTPATSRMFGVWIHEPRNEGGEWFDASKNVQHNPDPPERPHG